MFGLSFSELVVIAIVALVAVGPKKLPGMLHTIGQWIRRVRNITTEVRTQTGIDELLRMDSLRGSIDELKSLVRDQQVLPPALPTPAPIQPQTSWRDAQAFSSQFEFDLSREYPPEGPDSFGALPEDLLAPVSTQGRSVEQAKPVIQAVSAPASSENDATGMEKQASQ